MLAKIQKQAQELKQKKIRTPINLEEFDEESFNHMMERLEKRHKNVGLGKDLGARMKLITD